MAGSPGDTLAAIQNGVQAINNLTNTLTTAFSTIPQATTPGGSSGQVQFNNSGSFGGFTLGGDATLNSSAGTLTIASHAVTYGKIQTESSGTLLGNLGTGSTSPSEQPSSAVTAFLTPFSSAVQGVVRPSSNSNTSTSYLGGDNAFHPVSAGAMILLNTLTAANSSGLTDTTSLTATYTSYELIFDHIIPASNEQILQLNFYSSGTIQTSSYQWAQILSNGVSGGSTGSGPYVALSFNTAGNSAAIQNASPGYSGRFRIYNPSATEMCTTEGTCVWVAGTGTTTGGVIHGWWNSSNTVNGFQASMSSGAITTGVIRVYGIT